MNVESANLNVSILNVFSSLPLPGTIERLFRKMGGMVLPMYHLNK
jgi:hypothetical protein